MTQREGTREDLIRLLAKTAEDLSRPDGWVLGVAVVVVAKPGAFVYPGAMTAVLMPHEEDAARDLVEGIGQVSDDAEVASALTERDRMHGGPNVH